MPGPEASLCALSVHAALSRLRVPDTSVHATCTGCACCPVLQPLAVVGAHGSRRNEETWRHGRQTRCSHASSRPCSPTASSTFAAGSAGASRCCVPSWPLRAAAARRHTRNQFILSFRCEIVQCPSAPCPSHAGPYTTVLGRWCCSSRRPASALRAPAPPRPAGPWHV